MGKIDRTNCGQISYIKSSVQISPSYDCYNYPPCGTECQLKISFFSNQHYSFSLSLTISILETIHHNN